LIPASFTYRRAESVAEALELATAHGDDGKFLAGGHSLLPLMKLRLALPEVVIDIGRLRDLSYIRDEDGHVAIGALTRHHDVQHSELLAREIPLLAHAAGHVGDPQVRHCGTIGGSIAHADPASDLPAVVLALNGTLVTTGPSGTREIPAVEFFRGMLETALEPSELLTEIRLPKPAASSSSSSPASWSFQKFTKRAIDWAIVGVAVQGGSVALVNMGETPLRAAAVERALADGAAPREAAGHAAEGTRPASDINADREYREHLARVLVRRALEEAQART
jgi:carbon-monoxide dehydrogenase medium subunit